MVSSFGWNAAQANQFIGPQGHFKTRQLFWEMQLSDKSTVIYTLKDKPHHGYPSLYEAYMAEDDPTEYVFANKYLSGWEHWTVLCQCTFFKPYIRRWREELELRTKAKALQAIKAVADSDGKESYQAHKYLASLGWKESKRRIGAGRPSKSEIEAEKTRLAQEASNLDTDLERVLGKPN